jgi:hypothetical protein
MAIEGNNRRFVVKVNESYTIRLISGSTLDLLFVPLPHLLVAPLPSP